MLFAVKYFFIPTLTLSSPVWNVPDQGLDYNIPDT